jgi:type IV pilus assembly protein PilN
MIKINLFPFRAIRAKENIRRQVTIYLLSTIFILLALSYYALDLNKKVKILRADQQAKQQKLATFQATIAKLKQLEDTIRDVELKLKTIQDLEKDKTGPVRLLDDIAMSVPRDKLWLISLKEKAGTLALEGTAMDNETVADFMNRLESKESMNSVELVKTQQKEIATLKLNLMNFTITCKTYAYKEPEPPPAPKKKRK